MSPYLSALKEAMSLCAAAPNSVLMGQAVVVAGTGMFQTYDHIPLAQRLELPVFENTQMGMATGMALAGMLPVCIFPRMNFMLAAIDQIVNHLDKLPLYSTYKPKVLIRVAVPTNTPMDPGPQHLGDFSAAIEGMCSTLRVVRMKTPIAVTSEYRRALAHDGSTMLVEYSGLY